MAKRNRSTKKNTYQKRLKEGRGKGEGSKYRPWLKIQDVPSKGICTRIKGWKTGRVHHLLSLGELRYFYLLEWSPIVSDIREQFPLLPLERTLEIAYNLGIKHPADPKTKEPVVLTTDFLITVNTGMQSELLARTYKPSLDLSPRQCEKFLIEKEFYKQHGISWDIVTQEDIPTVISDNIEYLHNSYYLWPSKYYMESDVPFISNSIYKDYAKSSLCLSSITTKKDKDLGLQLGTSLLIVRHMLAQKKWITDMRLPILPTRRIVLKHVSQVQEMRRVAI